MPTFYVCDESGETMKYRTTTAQRAADRYVLTGDWNNDGIDDAGTQVHGVLVQRGQRGQRVRHMVVRTVPPPKCSRNAGRHVFRGNDAVGGENGGVRVTDTCKFCGMERVHKTRGQCRSTGQTVPGGTTSYRWPDRNDD